MSTGITEVRYPDPFAYPGEEKLSPTDENRSESSSKGALSYLKHQELDSAPYDDDDGLRVVNDGNPFPQDPNAPEETAQLTVRAVLVGSLLGLIVGASNIYLGLKTGFTFGGSLFGSIFGFAILKPLSGVLPTWFGGGYFGPKENCTVQAAATSAGGLTALFVAAVPAMYHLGLMTTPKQDIGRLFLLTAIAAFYGLFFAIPLRKYYILKQKLVFPSPVATAFTIRSLHLTTSAGARIAAKKKVLILAGSFAATFVFKSFCNYAPGLLENWHIFWWLYTWGWKGAIYGEAWGWIIQLTPAFFGVGLLSGLNASWSFMSGGILAWGLIGPLTIKYGVAVSKPLSEKIPEYQNYFSMAPVKGDYVHGGSPRYWLLWPGIMIMLCYSFAEIAFSAPIFWRSFKQVHRSIKFEYQSWVAWRAGRTFNDTRRQEDYTLDDPALPHEQVPVWAWTGGLALAVSGTIIGGKLSFGMDVGVSILALILAFIFSFIGVQSSGTADVNPVGPIAKASQLVVGGVTKGQGALPNVARTTNLIAGSIAGQAAQHGVDMTGDLKTGHLLRAAPQAQFWAQVLGALIGIWLSVGLFVLFSEAYPCLINLDIDCTNFSMPAVASWRSVAIAVTSPTLPIHPSAGYTAIVLGIAAILTVVLKETVIPRRYHVWVPNWNAIGLGFVVPQVYYPFAMVIGSHVAYLWAAKRPRAWELWGFALASGLIAGEGMSGVLGALLKILKVDGGVYGSAVACPENTYCG